MGERADTPEEHARRGSRWTYDEDAQLVHGIRSGQDARSMAGTHGRSVTAINARAARMVPAREGVQRGDAVEWLHRRFVVDPEYDWYAALVERGRSRSSGGSSSQSPRETTEPAPQHRVLEAWLTITDIDLSVEHRAEFLERPTVRELADHPDAVLNRAGQQLWTRSGRLWLDEWIAECRLIVHDR